MNMNLFVFVRCACGPPVGYVFWCFFVFWCFLCFFAYRTRIRNSVCVHFACQTPREEAVSALDGRNVKLHGTTSMTKGALHFSWCTLHTTCFREHSCILLATPPVLIQPQLGRVATLDSHFSEKCLHLHPTHVCILPGCNRWRPFQRKLGTSWVLSGQGVGFLELALDCSNRKPRLRDNLWKTLSRAEAEWHFTAIFLI